MKPKYVVLNSNLTIPGFPHNIEIRFAPSKKIFVAACQDATKYFFQLVQSYFCALRGKSVIIKFEFKTISVSYCSS